MSFSTNPHLDEVAQAIRTRAIVLIRLDFAGNLVAEGFRVSPRLHRMLKELRGRHMVDHRPHDPLVPEIAKVMLGVATEDSARTGRYGETWLYTFPNGLRQECVPFDYATAADKDVLRLHDTIIFYC